jgi:membrane associated rhomboid family serine protease
MTEFRPTSFQILPPVIKNLVIINVLVFIAQSTVEKSSNPDMLINLFALHAWQSPLFKPWQFVTHLFMHANIWHIAFNMFALWSFGSVLENLWGPKRFLTFYFICGLGAALSYMTVLYFRTNAFLESYNALMQHFTFGNFQNFFIEKHIGDQFKGTEDYDKVMNVVTQWRNNPESSSAARNAYALVQEFVSAQVNSPTVGASGAIFGCLTAFGYLFPNALLIGVPFFIPIKAKWAISAYILIELILGFINGAGDNVAHVAHLGGALFGFLLVYFWNKTNRRTFY